MFNVSWASTYGGYGAAFVDWLAPVLGLLIWMGIVLSIIGLALHLVAPSRSSYSILSTGGPSALRGVPGLAGGVAALRNLFRKRPDEGQRLYAHVMTGPDAFVAPASINAEARWSWEGADETRAAVRLRPVGAKPARGVRRLDPGRGTLGDLNRHARRVGDRG